MLHKRILANNGFRELNLEEVENVSGGWSGDEYGILQNSGITVTGTRGGGFDFGGLGGIGGIGSLGVAGSGLIGLLIPSDLPLPPEDLDGDGEPGITVTAERPGDLGILNINFNLANASTSISIPDIFDRDNLCAAGEILTGHATITAGYGGAIFLLGLGATPILPDGEVLGGAVLAASAVELALGYGLTYVNCP